MADPKQRRRLRRRDEAGYVAVVVALLASVLFIGMAAFGVDTARWYVEVERVQKTADAAALAGVTYMPSEFAKATNTAKTVAAKNGYDDAAADVRVTVGIGAKPSELKVTVSSRIDNAFGAGIGVSDAWVTRSAVADYTAPAPMGSPCNTFGNEPPPGALGPAPADTALPPLATRFPNCPVGGPGDQNAGFSSPKLWAGVEGPETDKLQGDRYQTWKCSEVSGVNTTDRTAFGCASSKNAEYKEQGYYLVIHVGDDAVGQQIDVQVYDPAFVPAGLACDKDLGTIGNTINDWVTDGTNRYGRYKTSISSPTVLNAAAQKFCTGDAFVGSSITTRGTTTTYVMRNKTETGNPDKATQMTGCPASSSGVSRPPS